MRTTSAFVAASLALIAPARAQEVPCKTASETGPMIVLTVMPTPEGVAMRPIKVGEAISVYDYAKRTVCLSFAGNPDLGVEITPSSKCFNADTKQAMDDTPVIATSQSGHKVAMEPRLDAIMERYEANRLTCKSAKADAPKVGA